MAAAAMTSPPGQQNSHLLSTKASSFSSSSSTSSANPSSSSYQPHPPSAHSTQEHHHNQTSAADALLQTLAVDHNNHSHSHNDQSPLSVHVEQLPTPRTSISSGASSPPETLSPSSTSHHNAGHPHSPTHTRQQPHLGLSSTAIASSPNAINGASSNVKFSHPTTYSRSPLQPQQPLYQRSSSPILSSKLGPSLYASSSANSSLAGAGSTTPFPATTPSAGTGLGVGGVSSVTTATSPIATTLGGRSLFQAHQHQQQHEFETQQHNHVYGHSQHHYNHQQSQHQQYQQQLQQEQLEEERELQKKNARSAISGVSAFLPPALNQSLTKVVQSAKDAVNNTPLSPLSATSKMSLPTSRLSTISEIGGRTANAFASRSSSSSSASLSTRLRHFNTSAVMQAIKLPMICLAWYMSSAVTNNIGKQIMNQFQYPITLTFVQFWFVSVFCFVAGAGFKMTRLRRPTRAIVEMTAPLVGFQVVGHVFSSVAISRVPLSVVHTVKALTPLFTVLFYRVVLGTTYSRPVYLSLVPLTAGVMLACRMSLEFNNLVGLSCALTSTLVFVMQNVFTKKILGSGKGKPQQEQSSQHSNPHHSQQDEVGMHGLGNRETISGGAGIGQSADPVDEALGAGPKLDKINILFYSSTLAAVCMIPMWFYAEGSTLMFSEDPLDHASGSGGTWRVISWLLFLNGVSHFFQNFLAFSVLALTSPVTYSIASLVKRIVVIVASIIYFHQTLGATQWTGVCMTFWGLWMYNSAKNAAKVTPGSGILASTKVGRRMSRGFGRLDEEVQREGSGSGMGSSRSKVGFKV